LSCPRSHAPADLYWTGAAVLRLARTQGGVAIYAKVSPRFVVVRQPRPPIEAKAPSRDLDDNPRTGPVEVPVLPEAALVDIVAIQIWAD
jgi:hypothetical protein